MRDMVAVAVIAAVTAYALTRLNYQSLPQLPRLAGLTAALLGIGEVVAGHGLRGRIRQRRDDGAPETTGRRPLKPPVPPLVAARALRVAKASALAGAVLAGLWLGFGGYVLPRASVAAAAAADSVTATVGLVCALILLAGALYLENCCRAPQDGPPPTR